MEELNEQQRQDIIRKRQEMLKRMGVQNGGKMMNESIVATNAANASMASKIAAIRGGNAKGEFSKFINATGKNAPGGAGTPGGGFEALPEPKMRKNPNQVKEEIKPEYRQQLQDFGNTGGNQELSAIDAMFGGDGGGSRMSHPDQVIAQNPVNLELNIDNVVMPAFNPQAAIQAKMRQQQQPQQQQGQNPYLKYANQQPNMGGQEQFVDVGTPVTQPQFNMGQLQMMMETIAKGIAEKTIRSVLNEYSEQQKGKVFFEYYNKEKGIIKTPDGKYYRLTQVELKKK